MTLHELFAGDPVWSWQGEHPGVLPPFGVCAKRRCGFVQRREGLAAVAEGLGGARLPLPMPNAENPHPLLGRGLSGSIVISGGRARFALIGEHGTQLAPQLLDPAPQLAHALLGFTLVREMVARSAERAERPPQRS